MRLPGLAFLAAAAQALLLVASPPCAAQVQDVALKAAYIYNFALFATWPPQAAENGALLVCASRSSALWESLLGLNGKSVNGRAWTLIEFPPASEPKKCDIAVVTASGGAQRSAPAALVISDVGVAGSNAAAITLVTEADHVRFDIDSQEATRSGVKFSSKLLRLARNVL
jgi:hypothetical protein